MMAERFFVWGGVVLMWLAVFGAGFFVVSMVLHHTLWLMSDFGETHKAWHNGYREGFKRARERAAAAADCAKHYDLRDEIEKFEVEP